MPTYYGKKKQEATEAYYRKQILEQKILPENWEIIKQDSLKTIDGETMSKAEIARIKDARAALRALNQEGLDWSAKKGIVKRRTKTVTPIDYSKGFGTSPSPTKAKRTKTTTLEDIATNPPPRSNTVTPATGVTIDPATGHAIPAGSKLAKGNPPARANKGTPALPKGGSLTKVVKDHWGLPQTVTAKPGHYFDQYGNDMLIKYGEMPKGGSKTIVGTDETWGLKETKTAPPGKYYGPDGKLHDLPSAPPPPKPTGGKISSKEQKLLREIGAWVAGPAAAAPAAKPAIPSKAAVKPIDYSKKRKNKNGTYSPGR